MIETTKLYILIPVYLFLTFVEGHSCMGNEKKFCLEFLASFSVDRDKISMLSLPVGLLKHMVNSICMFNI